MWLTKFAAMGGLGILWPHPPETLLAKEDGLEDQIEDPRSCKGHVRALLRAIPPKGGFGEEDPHGARVC
jgi:hypothetical protein